MNFYDFNKEAMKTLNPDLDWEQRLYNGLLGLSGEVGELSDIVKKWQFQGHDIDLDKVKLELGDTLYYLNLTAENFGFSLEDCAEAVIDKLQKRYPNGFDVERSVNRGDYDDTDSGIIISSANSYPTI